MYEWVRIFLLNNKLDNDYLKGEELTVLYDNHEIDFPVDNLEVLHKDGRFLNIKFDDCHSPMYENHLNRLALYKKDKITKENYNFFLD